MNGIVIRRVAEPADLRAANALFREVFAHEYGYDGPEPGEEYARQLLADPGFVMLIAERDGDPAGAIAGYELRKYEAERSEYYIYDLAVREEHRRQGVATALMEAVGEIAAERGAWVVMIQADPVDAPAVALYDKLGTREEVLHFDISPASGRPAR
jgi:aminoglycoside 3-N-acetyltransferase I